MDIMNILHTSTGLIGYKKRLHKKLKRNYAHHLRYEEVEAGVGDRL